MPSPFSFPASFTPTTDADLGAQTVVAVATGIGTVTLSDTASKASTQTAINAIIADLNDLKAKLRVAGVLAT